MAARPRSCEAHAKIIAAAIKLFGDLGIEAASMDAVAQTAGVSKATIYNHWENKEALLLEVMLHVNGLDREREEIDTGDLVLDLTTILCRKPPGELEAARQRLTPPLIAYSAVHPEFGHAWRHRVMEPPRQHLRRALQRGIDRGELPPDLDMDLAMALLLGPMLYTHIFSKQAAEKRDIGPETAQAFVRAFTIRTTNPI